MTIWFIAKLVLAVFLVALIMICVVVAVRVIREVWRIRRRKCGR